MEISNSNSQKLNLNGDFEWPLSNLMLNGDFESPLSKVNVKWRFRTAANLFPVLYFREK
jgi:hypothetical protein